MTAPIELYYWPTPNGWKISIALEELGLAYNVNYINIGKDEQFAPDFLAIAPNNRIPAIVDPEGPDGAPISVFETGAILQYLARKTGKLYGTSERDRVAVEEWLMWQMGGLGPMAGQAHQFLAYGPYRDPPVDIPFAKDRYRNEVTRLYGVMDRRLAENEFLAGDFFSIADIACIGWASLWDKQHQDLSDKPNLVRWLAAVGTRPGVERGMAVGANKRRQTPDGRNFPRVIVER